MNKSLIFGRCKPDIQYTERNAAYVVIIESNKVAMVKPKEKYFLPGGGGFANESAEDTILREVREELSRNIRLTGRIGEVIQYFYSSTDDQHYRMHATFFTGEFADETSYGASENELYWLPLTETIGELCFHECHAWAIRQAQ